MLVDIMVVISLCAKYQFSQLYEQPVRARLPLNLPGVSVLRRGQTTQMDIQMHILLVYLLHLIFGSSFYLITPSYCHSADSSDLHTSVDMMVDIDLTMLRGRKNPKHLFM